MSLARALGEYFVACKNNGWLLRPSNSTINVLPNHLTNQVRESLPITRVKQNDQKLLDEHYSSVGKGSHFERHNVQSYLRPLGFDKLKRSQTVESPPFDDVSGSESYEMERNNSADVAAMNRQIFKDIIESLVKITPKPKSIYEISTIAINDQSISYKSPYFKHSYSEVPPIPNFENNPEKFEQYIYTLSHSTFHHKNSSKFNGIVPKILQNLFHPLNHSTLALRTPNSFNFMLHYYSLKWNMATCRELIVQMRFENIHPTTTTYNIMIKNLLTLKHIKHTSNPYHIALKHLKQMSEQKLKADIVTWNLIFKLLSDDASKSAILINRRKLNIPLDTHSVQAILRFLVEEKNVTAYALIKLINDYGISIDSKLLTYIVRKLVKEDQGDAALKLVNYANEKFGIKVSPDLLNPFLIRFSEIGRVDLVVATINKFRAEYNVKPDFASYNLVMKTLSNANYWDKKLQVWRILYQKMMKHTKGNVSGEYWIRRLRARMKFIYEHEVNLSEPFTEKEVLLKEKMDQITYDFEIPYDLKKQSPEYKRIARLLGCYYRPSSEMRLANPELEKKKLKAKRYKDKITKLSIQKAMVKRIPYAQDQYKALKDELKERNLIHE